MHVCPSNSTSKTPSKICKNTLELNDRFGIIQDRIDELQENIDNGTLFTDLFGIKKEKIRILEKIQLVLSNNPNITIYNEKSLKDNCSLTYSEIRTLKGYYFHFKPFKVFNSKTSVTLEKIYNLSPGLTFFQKPTETQSNEHLPISNSDTLNTRIERPAVLKTRSGRTNGVGFCYFKNNVEYAGEIFEGKPWAGTWILPDEFGSNNQFKVKWCNEGVYDVWINSLEKEKNGLPIWIYCPYSKNEELELKKKLKERILNTLKAHTPAA